jgi:purine catabolism regulatory family protein/PucR-like helix-turn-helix protein/diguanylate cyclase with GGDEF domain
MPITVDELLGLPHLALDLLAGADGLDAPISWAHVAEVEDPTPWLEGGELILTTGIGLPAAAAGQVAYARRLARARAAGVVIVSDSAPPLTPALIAAADELGLPLVSTVLKQPFQPICRVVYAANAHADGERTVAHLRIYGVLRAAAADGAGPVEVLTRLEATTGLQLAVVREDGHPQFGRGPAHPRWPEVRDVLDGAGSSARRGLYARLEGDADRPGGYAIQVDVPLASRVFLVAEGVSAAAMPDLVAVHHIATIVAAQVQSQRAERAVRRKVGAELLSELVEGPVDASARARVLALDMPDAPLAALVLRPEGEVDSALADLLHDGLLDRDAPALVGIHRGDLIVVAPTADDPETLARTAQDIFSAGQASPCAIGVGTPGPLTHVRVSYREALVAADHADGLHRGITSFARLKAALAWLPAEPERLSLLVDGTVGPLLEYDRAHRTQLVRSLREFLQANRSPSRATATLHVHRNTLTYRLRKIEELTARSLDSMDDQVELWLGLRALELASQPAADLR